MNLLEQDQIKGLAKRLPEISKGLSPYQDFFHISSRCSIYQEILKYVQGSQLAKEDYTVDEEGIFSLMELLLQG